MLGWVKPLKVKVGRKENGSSGGSRTKKLPFARSLNLTAPNPTRNAGCGALDAKLVRSCPVGMTLGLSS